jgi:ADP-heptose:LPS heptosyltransferase
VGVGDEIMASGMARGAAQRGERIAFGDGRRIIWSAHSPMVFAGNPNVARPGDEDRFCDLRWIEYYKGHRIYSKLAQDQSRWIWNYAFKAPRGEIFLSANERKAAAALPAGFVLVEPNVLLHKSWTQNKVWPYYQELVDRLDVEVFQFSYVGMHVRLRGVTFIETGTMRSALVLLSRAGLYIGPEGGLQHGAAAFDIPGVVLFGGWSPPSMMGYPGHINLTGGAEACGAHVRCAHCEKAMRAITVDEVHEAAIRCLAS